MRTVNKVGGVNGLSYMEFYGNSTDIKPTDDIIPNGSVFYEIDHNMQEYRWDKENSIWRKISSATTGGGTTATGEYIPLTGTETDKPVTGNIEFKPAADSGGNVSSFTLGSISQYGNVLGCFDFTNTKFIFGGSSILFVCGTDLLASFTESGLTFIDNDDTSKEYKIDFSTGKSGRISFMHSDGSGPDTGSVELNGINTITMKFAETGAKPTIKATDASTITLTSEDSNVSNDLTLTGLALPVNDKDAVNKQYVDSAINSVLQKIKSQTL